MLSRVLTDGELRLRAVRSARVSILDLASLLASLHFAYPLFTSMLKFICSNFIIVFDVKIFA